MKPRRVTSFVPGIVLKTLYAGVVPAVAASSLGACAISLAMTAFDTQHTDATDTSAEGAADAGFDAGTDASPGTDVMGVADAGFDGGTDTGPADEGVIVLAVIGFDFEGMIKREPALAQFAVEPRARTRRERA